MSVNKRDSPQQAIKDAPLPAGPDTILPSSQGTTPRVQVHKHNKGMFRGEVEGPQHRSSSRLLYDLLMWDVALGACL